jgi:outer membrane murein-binding lipoprotein Lpp
VVQVTEARYEQLLAAEAERDQLAAALKELRRGVLTQLARQDQLSADVSALAEDVRAFVARSDGGIG